MGLFRAERLVEWGDCDAAGIVFYPNYFRWMDGTFHAFTRRLGFDQRSLMAGGLLGTPLVDAGCTFRSPARYYDTLGVSLSVTALGGSSLSLSYTFRVGDRVTAQGHEVRAFVAETDRGIAARAMPDAVRAAVEAFRAGG